ncbi:hypothetical protein MMC31_003659, partial [Peltigera leucophlebia]|nr:hypothetical protein [Peltigera leucophlebia]
MALQKDSHLERLEERERQARLDADQHAEEERRSRLDADRHAEEERQARLDADQHAEEERLARHQMEQYIRKQPLTNTWKGATITFQGVCRFKETRVWLPHVHLRA